MVVMALDESAIRQWVCIILKLALHSINHGLIPDGRGVERIYFLMLARVSRVHARCALGHSDVARAVPRWPPGSESSFEMIGTGVPSTRTLARRDCRASFRSVFRLISCSALM